MVIFELNFEDWAEVSYVYETEKKKRAFMPERNGQSKGGGGLWELQTP